ncbi:MAG: nuclear transport factor 2 family protein [Bacteroidota bacterium]
MTLQDTFEIEQLIARFANSFDVGDWDGLRGCLTGSIFTDYTDLRGTPPANVSSQEYADSRRKSLENVTTHHLAGNYEIAYMDDQNATCRASMMIWRTSAQGQFASHCIYLFRIEKSQMGWRISGITQKVLWNEGDASIHPAK